VLSLSAKTVFPENLLREFGHKLMNSRIESSTEPRQRPRRFNISLRILATSKTALRNVWTSVTIGAANAYSRLMRSISATRSSHPRP
jgi:hypothetical protein